MTFCIYLYEYLCRSVSGFGHDNILISLADIIFSQIITVFSTKYIRAVITFLKIVLAIGRFRPLEFPLILVSAEADFIALTEVLLICNSALTIIIIYYILTIFFTLTFHHRIFARISYWWLQLHTNIFSIRRFFLYGLLCDTERSSTNNNWKKSRKLIFIHIIRFTNY